MTTRTRSSSERSSRGSLGPFALVSGVVLVVGVLLAAGLAMASLPAPSVHVVTGGKAASATPSTLVPPSSARASSPHPSFASPTWMNLTSDLQGARLPDVYAESLAYDPIANVTLLFGGCLGPQCPSNQTWAFANGSWSNLTPASGSPPARDYASMDFDPNMGGVLLFGGDGVGGTPLNDTWLFSGGAWTNVTYVGGGPSPRFGASMAFDPDPEENGSVLYGGCVAADFSDNCYNDTWVWQGWSGWVPLYPSLGGPGVGFSAMAFDPADDYLVLFGGCAGVFCFGISNQTWEFVSGQWWEIQPTPAPVGRTDAAMAYDPVGMRLLLFGGIDSSLAFDADTWSFSGGHWTSLATGTAPFARADAGLAPAPPGSALLLVGGSTSGPYENDTWAWGTPPSVSLAPAANASETSQPVNFTAIVSGGAAPFALLVGFGDGAEAWVLGAGPSFTFVHSYLAEGTFTATVNLTDAVGMPANASAPGVELESGPMVTATALPSVGEVGIAINFATNLTSRGVPPTAYSWEFGDGTSGSGAAPSHTYSTAGSYSATVTVTDSLGGTANVSLVVLIRPALSVSVVPQTSDPNTSTLEGFLAGVSGGVGPYQYAWSFGDGNSSVAPAPVERYGQAGPYTVSVYVNDSLGGVAHASLVLTVIEPSSSSSGGSSLASAPLWFWGGLGGLFLAGAVGSLVILRRHPTGR